VHGFPEAQSASQLPKFSLTADSLISATYAQATTVPPVFHELWMRGFLSDLGDMPQP
jgi:hypothetical protein